MFLILVNINDKKLPWIPLAKAQLNQHNEIEKLYKIALLKTFAESCKTAGLWGAFFSRIHKTSTLCSGVAGWLTGNSRQGSRSPPPHTVFCIASEWSRLRKLYLSEFIKSSSFFNSNNNNWSHFLHEIGFAFIQPELTEISSGKWSRVQFLVYPFNNYNCVCQYRSPLTIA